MAKRVAIIGAGCSGLPGIKYCLEESLVPVCFEKRGEIGGLWNYTKVVTKGQACIMKSTITNTNKTNTCYSDYPVPKEFPSFLTHEKMIEYLQGYVKKFDLAKHIHFHTEVTKIARTEDFARTGRWQVDWKDMESGECKSEIFDAVLVANGHLDEPIMPKFEGHDKFKGVQIHAQDYREPDEFVNKRVIVVGMSNSGGDIAVELAKTCSQVYFSTRNGAWMMPRLLEHGIPFDTLTNTRFAHLQLKLLPKSVSNSSLERIWNARFDHASYAMKPKHRFLQQLPFINDELPLALVTGRVQVKSNVRRFTETGVVFDDGSTAEDIDAVIYATGYYYRFPFLEKKLDDYEYTTSLYKWVFEPDMAPATMAIIGLINPYGPLHPTAEIQCRWALKVFKGELKLPSKEDMELDVEATKKFIADNFLNHPRYAIFADWVGYMDNIAEFLNCKPNLGELVKSDPRLAWAVFFDPVIPAQYRLQGPNVWPGAREVVLSTWDYIAAPLKTRAVPDSNSLSDKMGMIAFLVVILAVIWYFLCKQLV